MLLTRNAITRPVTSPIAPPTSSPGASRSIARSTECNSVSKSSCAAGTTRTPTIAPTTGAATRNVSCQNWLATWSEIRWRSACCPSRKPVVPKIAAKTSRRTAVPIPRPGSVGEKRATDVVRYESAALREAQARASGGEDARRDQIVDHLPIPRFHIDAVPFAEARQVDSFGGSEGQHDRLAGLLGTFEPLALARDRLAGECRPAVLLQIARVRRPDPAQVRRSADPQPQIRIIGPVELVVLGAEPRPRPVRDLVVLEFGGPEPLHRGRVHRGLARLVGERRRIAREPGRVRRSLLDREAVARDVLDAERDRRIQRRRPARLGLARCAEDQIDRDVGESGDAGGAHRALDVGRGMPPPEHAQFVRIERLHADREPVHPGRAQPGDPRGQQRVGVRLGGDFGVARQREPRAHLGDQPTDDLRRIHRRRPAAEEQRSRRDRRRRRELRAQRLEIPRRPRIVPRPLREITIRAHIRTERQVHVDAAAIGNDARHQPGMTKIPTAPWPAWVPRTGPASSSSIDAPAVVIFSRSFAMIVAAESAACEWITQRRAPSALFASSAAASTIVSTARAKVRTRACSSTLPRSIRSTGTIFTSEPMKACARETRPVRTACERSGIVAKPRSTALSRASAPRTAAASPPARATSLARCANSARPPATDSLSTTWISAPGNAWAAVFAALIVPERLPMIVRQTIARPAVTCGRNASSNIAGVGCAVVGSTLRLASLRSNSS